MVKLSDNFINFSILISQILCLTVFWQVMLVACNSDSEQRQEDPLPKATVEIDWDQVEYEWIPAEEVAQNERR